MQNKITISKGEETEGIGKSNFLHHLAKNKLTRKFTEALKGLIKITGRFFQNSFGWNQGSALLMFGPKMAKIMAL